MPITWKLEITRAIIPNGDTSRVHTKQFEADTIREAKEKADDISKPSIEQEYPALASTGHLEPDLDWTVDHERNRITKVYSPRIAVPISPRTPITQEGTQHFLDCYVIIEPIDISLSEISDAPEMQ